MFIVLLNVSFKGDAKNQPSQRVEGDGGDMILVKYGDSSTYFQTVLEVIVIVLHSVVHMKSIVVKTRASDRSSNLDSFVCIGVTEIRALAFQPFDRHV